METSYGTLLEEALEAWRGVRNGVIAEVANIPADRLGFRPADGARSVLELVHHVVQSGLMMSGELSRRDGDFSRQSFAEHIAEYAAAVPETTSRDGLLTLLRESHESGERGLREAGELHSLQYIRRFDGLPGTRLAWLNHGIAHESHHRGQIAAWARIMGVTPALTKRIHGE